MKKIRFILLIIFMLTFVCLEFPLTYQNSLAVDDPTIDLIMPENVIIGDKPEYLEFVAELSSTETYTADKLVWFINGSAFTTGITFQGSTSTLKVLKSSYNNIVSRTTWNVLVKVSTNDNINITKQLIFDFSDVDSVSIIVNGPLIQEISDNITPVTFQAEIEGYPSTTNIQWFEKSYANKYTKITNSTLALTISPSKPGTYTYKCSVNGVFSQPSSITVNFKPVTELVLTCQQATDNATGLNRYIFSLENLSSDNDLSKIRWYTRQNGLLQQGGSSFEFQTTLYGSYYVYATYDDTDEVNKLQSETYPIEIKIDRTKEILIGCGIAFGVMVVFLLIGIVITVKRDKVW